MPKALVIGSRGQDGCYLSELLQNKGYELIALSRSGIDGPLSNEYPGFSLNSEDVGQLLRAERPDEVYYLAAFHNSAEDSPIDELELLHKCLKTNTLHAAEVLYAISIYSPDARTFYAASSHIFGEPSSQMQNERTPLDPVSAYGISKAAGVHVCRYFRKRHNLYASVGILYNHESPRRPARFLSKKVVQAAVRIKRGQQDRLVLGSLDTMVDWGFAGDYVAAMWQILQLKDPDDFVIATGILRPVRDFVVTVFEMLDLDWSKYIVKREEILTKLPATLCGDSSKLRRIANWQPETGFKELIQIMVQAELNGAV